MDEVVKRPGMEFVPGLEPGTKVNALALHRGDLYAATDRGLYVLEAGKLAPVPVKAPPSKTCKCCGEPFTAGVGGTRRADALFCSDMCRKRSHYARL